MFLTSEDLKNYQKVLDDYKENPAISKNYSLIQGIDNKKLWDYKYSLKATMNQDTGKILPLPFRMYFFVPMNIPIAFGLICLPATKLNIMTFNLLNQTYNASVNYMNGSGTSDSAKLLTISYICALTSSIGTGLLLKRVLKPQLNAHIAKEMLIRFLPSCIAGFLNIFCMRFDYILNGINIRDEKGRILGLSKYCGSKALLEGGLTRFVLPIPLIIQFLIIRKLKKRNIGKRIFVCMELCLCAIALGIGLPFSIAIFKQYSKVHISKVEKEFSNVLDENNKPIEWVLYNKGL